MKLGGLKQGIWGLISLDGGPLDPACLAGLGLPEGAGALGCRLRAVDAMPAAIGYGRGGAEVLLGFLDEPAELAATLRIDGGSPVELLSAAVDRFGNDAPVHVLGEWGYVRWDGVTLTVVCSETLRDPLFFASDGRQVALAPEMIALGRLPWVGLAVDMPMLALTMSRAGLRHGIGDGTVWQGVRRAAPGTSERFTAAGRTTLRPTAEPVLEPWAGSYEEAIESIDTLGRRLVRQQMERYGKTAFLLSGGLDSSLLTAWGAMEQGPGRTMSAICSVAPAGSGLPDERRFAEAVAESLGVRLELIAPPVAWSAYRPADEVFRSLESPAVGVRHYMYEALSQAAEREGAHGLVDGMYGEHTVTDKTPLPFRFSALRDSILNVRIWLSDRPKPLVWPGDAFHVKFSREFLASLPAEWEQRWQVRQVERGDAVRRGRIGIHPAVSKNAGIDTSTTSELRLIMPFRDRRLLRAVAPMPASYLHHGKMTRSMARTLLAGRIPDFVRLRPWGMPFSPDYDLRLQTQATEALGRVKVFQEAGLDRIFDLEWVASELKRLSTGVEVLPRDQFAAQITVITAEFMMWAEAKLD